MAQHELQVYKDAAGEFRWRKVTLSIGDKWEVVSESGEGYTERNDAAEAAERENPSLVVVYLDEG